MEQLHNLRENLLEMYDDIHLLRNNNFGFQYCDILKELNKILKGCEKFKHVVMTKNVVPSSFIKPLDFFENAEDSEINEVIHRINKKILKLDESLLSSKNYNDIYKFVRNLDSVERDVSKLIRFIKGSSSSQQTGGGGIDDIANNVEKLSQIGKEVETKLVETSSLINRLEEEFTKMNPVYTEKLDQMHEVCFPKCSIKDGKWASHWPTGMEPCSVEDIAQEKKAREYFNANLNGRIYLDTKSKNKQVIDNVCKDDFVPAPAPSDAAVVNDTNCFPACSIFEGKWAGFSNCKKQDMKKEQAARENYKLKTGKVLLQGRHDFKEIIDPKYICH